MKVEIEEHTLLKLKDSLIAPAYERATKMFALIISEFPELTDVDVVKFRNLNKEFEKNLIECASNYLQAVAKVVNKPEEH